MASATYASLLLRAHLRNLAPLPKDELTALLRSMTELRAVGRNLNQIARAANQGGRVNGPSGEDLLAVLRACEGLRVHTKALLRTNITSWEVGYAEANG
jgi:Bacterial mobilisation protein (MobC)